MNANQFKRRLKRQGCSFETHGKEAATSPSDEET